MAFKINERCTGCAACAGECPTNAIHGARDAGYVIDPARCIECGACGVACADEAVSDARGEVFALYAPTHGPTVVVDLGRCSGCGWCAEACGVDAIVPTAATAPDGTTVRFPVVSPRRCIACDACALACSAGALTVLRRDSPAYTAAESARRRFLQSLGLRTDG